MQNFSQLLQQGAGHAWFFIPTAVLLGALHGLEPGHSKTMMAAFIVAVRGTIKQAVLLGLSAALSHTAIIWLLAAGALHYGGRLNAETTEPYFQLASAVIIAGLALWMLWRTRRDVHAAATHSHDHDHNGHSHSGMEIDTGPGDTVKVSVFEEGVPPVFRLRFFTHGKETAPPDAQDVRIETIRHDGTRQLFHFAAKGSFLESTANIPEPHEFKADISLAHGDHAHTYTVAFVEGEHHHHHDIVAGVDYQDAHEQAHAMEIAQRFNNREVTTGQIVLFGLSGGLMPCPAAFSILLICLQLKKTVLGFSLVAAFSVGLAITLVASGTLAAWSVKHAERKFRGFGEFARKIPYLSSAFLFLVAVYIAIQGWKGLVH